MGKDYSLVRSSLVILPEKNLTSIERRGPLSLVRIIEELLERKVVAPV
jgi:hypothetical protein